MKSSTYFSKVSYLDKTGVEINMKENTCEHIEMLVRYCYTPYSQMADTREKTGA